MFDSAATPVKVTEKVLDNTLNVIYCQCFDEWYYKYNINSRLNPSHIKKVLQSQGEYTKLYLNDKGDIIFETKITLEDLL